MRYTLLSLVFFVSLLGLSQQVSQSAAGSQSSPTPTPTPQQRTENNSVQPVSQPVSPQPAIQPVAISPRSCLAVKPVGSHAFRNVMLFGVAGALISKQQYQVIDAVNYPAHIGHKFHGSDLQTISNNGTRIVILDKHYTTDDLHKACQ